MYQSDRFTRGQCHEGIRCGDRIGSEWRRWGQGESTVDGGDREGVPEKMPLELRAKGRDEQPVRRKFTITSLE